MNVENVLEQMYNAQAEFIYIAFSIVQNDACAAQELQTPTLKPQIA